MFPVLSCCADCRNPNHLKFMQNSFHCTHTSRNHTSSTQGHQASQEVKAEDEISGLCGLEEKRAEMSPCRSRVKPVSTLIHRRSFFVFAHGNFMGVYIHIYSSGGTLKFSKIMTQDMFFDNETTRMQTLKTPRKHVLPPGCNASFGISNGCE